MINQLHTHVPVFNSLVAALTMDKMYFNQNEQVGLIWSPEGLSIMNMENNQSHTACITIYYCGIFAATVPLFTHLLTEPMQAEQHHNSVSKYNKSMFINITIMYGNSCAFFSWLE